MTRRDIALFGVDARGDEPVLLRVARPAAARDRGDARVHRPADGRDRRTRATGSTSSGSLLAAAGIVLLRARHRRRPRPDRRRLRAAAGGSGAPTSCSRPGSAAARPGSAACLGAMIVASVLLLPVGIADGGRRPPRPARSWRSASASPCSARRSPTCSSSRRCGGCPRTGRRRAAQPRAGRRGGDRRSSRSTRHLAAARSSRSRSSSSPAAGALSSAEAVGRRRADSARLLGARRGSKPGQREDGDRRILRVGRIGPRALAERERATHACCAPPAAGCSESQRPAPVAIAASLMPWHYFTLYSRAVRWPPSAAC